MTDEDWKRLEELEKKNMTAAEFRNVGAEPLTGEEAEELRQLVMQVLRDHETERKTEP
jgi:hypothetical protein